MSDTQDEVAHVNAPQCCGGESSDDKLELAAAHSSNDQDNCKNISKRKRVMLKRENHMLDEIPKKVAKLKSEQNITGDSMVDARTPEGSDPVEIIPNGGNEEPESSGGDMKPGEDCQTGQSVDESSPEGDDMSGRTKDPVESSRAEIHVKEIFKMLVKDFRRKSSSVAAEDSAYFRRLVAVRLNEIFEELCEGYCQEIEVGLYEQLPVGIAHLIPALRPHMPPVFTKVKSFFHWIGELLVTAMEQVAEGLCQAIFRKISGGVPQDEFFHSLQNRIISVFESHRSRIELRKRELTNEVTEDINRAIRVEYEEYLRQEVVRMREMSRNGPRCPSG